MTTKTPEATDPADAAGAQSTAPVPDQLEKLQNELETWKGYARKHEDRAKANSDAADKVTTLEAEIANLKDVEAQVPAKVAAALKAHVVALHSIPEDTAAALLTASDPETLMDQVQALQGLVGGTVGASAPLEGNRPDSTGGDEMTTFLDALVGND